VVGCDGVPVLRRLGRRPDLEFCEIVVREESAGVMLAGAVAGAGDGVEACEF